MLYYGLPPHNKVWRHFSKGQFLFVWNDSIMGICAIIALINKKRNPCCFICQQGFRFLF